MQGLRKICVASAESGKHCLLLLPLPLSWGQTEAVLISRTIVASLKSCDEGRMQTEDARISQFQKRN